MQAKCHRSSKRVKYGDKTEKISNLPDEILGLILSFLPTKHAVRTSILSRRWRYLFTLITNIDFDESLLFDRTRYQNLFDIRMLHNRRQVGSETLKLSSSFKDFVDRVLMLCKSPHISKFRLNCGLHFDCSNLNTWIRVALFRGVTDLDISTFEYNSSVLPLSLFTSETLVVLKLRGDFEMKVPLSLPHLKSLHVFNVKFSDEDCSLNRFIEGCPVLENLVVGGGHWKDVEVINISSSRLRSLTMDFVEGFMSCYHRSSILLDLPNLVYFNYIDFLANDYVLNNLNSLEEARIEVMLDVDNTYSDQIFSRSIVSLINGLSNAKHLYLSGKCMEALDWEYTLPILPNLSILELGWTKYVYWSCCLREILQSAPVLEHLIFAEGLMHRRRDDDHDSKKFWSKQRKAPSCLSSHLKTVTFDSFHGFDEELAIARYFLRHGKVLKNMIIDWRIDTKQEFQKLMKLLKKARASEECSIELMAY